MPEVMENNPQNTKKDSDDSHENASSTEPELIVPNTTNQAGIGATETLNTAGLLSGTQSDHPLDGAQLISTSNVLPNENVGGGSEKHTKFDHLISKKRVFVMLGVLFIAIVMVLLVGLVVLNNSNKYTIFGMNINKNLSQADLEKQVQSKFNSLTISVQNGDKKITKYAYADAGVTINAKQTVENALNKINMTGILEKVSWWENRELLPVVLIDKAKMEQFIATNTVTVIVQAEDATLAIDNEQVINTASQNGSAYSVKDASKQISQSAKNGLAVTLVGTKQILKPSITTEMVKQIKDQAETIIQKNVVFTINGKSFSPTKANIASWIEPISNGTSKPELRFSKDKISIYLDRIAADFVSMPKSEIAVTGDDGVKRVYVVGQNGSDITNKDVVASAVAEELISQPSVQKKLEVSTKTYETILPNYSKWILVSLSAHKLQAYENNNLIKEIKVSAGAPATPTVTGTFKIYTKIRSQDMRGLNADGTKYMQPNVEWVNYFYKDYALHGNYWRPASWFGAINGSHGCVGMLNPDAQWVYNWAPVGTTVIVY